MESRLRFRVAWRAPKMSTGTNSATGLLVKGAQIKYTLTSHRRSTEHHRYR